jgi:hypothetical protein
MSTNEFAIFWRLQVGQNGTSHPNTEGSTIGMRKTGYQAVFISIVIDSLEFVCDPYIFPHAIAKQLKILIDCFELTICHQNYFYRDELM